MDESVPEVEAYVAAARRLELMALDLAQRKVEQSTAISALIEAAGGDIRVMRRAHRHCEFALTDQWPAAPTLIRAYDYLSAGRRELEAQQVKRNGAAQASVKARRDNGRGVSATHLDAVEEAGMESFPASDAPAFWGR